ncbi:MAG: hypothetical protein JST06_01305 [Bacteroidetes bacterium]|nr:hypothetical protein [Bacteroidota bacterium]MBS1629169.1 hypothetical protein [Bacteroidota bacterium]
MQLDTFALTMLKMKWMLFILVLPLFAGCKQEAQYSDSYVHAMVDSIVGQRMEEINHQAMEDLDQRMTIELKQKADSIVAVREAAWRSEDSARQINQAPQR